MAEARRRKKAAARTVARDLLLELGTEELPPRALRRLSEELGAQLHRGLSEAGLLAQAQAGYEVFATPRRLAVRVAQVLERQPDRSSSRRGPALTAAFDAQGRPTPAALGFARSCGVVPEALERRDNYLAHTVVVKGERAARLIPAILEEALKRLPIPRRMRWGEGEAEFVRPVHWVVLLHGDAVIDAQVLSVRTGRETRGHRFHHPQPLRLASAASYPGPLETRGHVVADFVRRKDMIRKGVEALARRKKGVAQIDDALLEEVTALVEWPRPLLGGFDPAYLEVPAEALVTTMRDNQRYFPVIDDRGRLLAHFIAVANIESRKPEAVRAGNERVLRARFADARFFWETDRKLGLEARAAGLKDVVFHVKLGSVHDKVERAARLATAIARHLGADAAAAARAARLAKADLLTGMVGEFPELQGVMGRYYARHDGEPAEVAAAIEEQYLPRFAGGPLPKTATGRALAIADKLDTLVGIFAIGETPSGDKDPFALRRAALGALRIMIEGRCDLDLRVLLAQAAEGYAGMAGVGAADVLEPVYAFMMERLRAYYLDTGVSVDVFESVLARAPSRPFDFDQRVRAVMAFRKLEEAQSLTAANKRIRNILRQAGGVSTDHVSDLLLNEPAERALAQELGARERELAPVFAAGDYTQALKRLARLRRRVDEFFDQVMVMAQDDALRNNRLALLNRLSELFLRVADLSRLQG